MRQILRVDTAAIIAYDDLHNRSESTPCNMDGGSCFCVVKSVFYDIADCFDQSGLVAHKGDFLIP